METSGDIQTPVKRGIFDFIVLRNVQMALENAVSTNMILSLLGPVLSKFVESLPLRDFQTVLKSSSKLTNTIPKAFCSLLGHRQ